MPSSRLTKRHWDSWLILSQIISYQSIHYLFLCFIIPPLVQLFAERTPLAFEGGPANIGFVMDWRELCSRPTIAGLQGPGQLDWRAFASAYSGGKKIGIGALNQTLVHMSGRRMDPRRGWCIAFAWIIACFADVYFLYLFVRRPRLILDFVSTFVLIHVILTTSYSEALPSAIFFWITILGGAFITVTVAEQLCVKRELREGLAIEGLVFSDGRTVELELEALSDE